MNFRKSGAMIATVLAVVSIGLGSWSAQSWLKKKGHAQMGESLSTVLATTHQALRSWVKEQKSAALIWANMPEVHQYAEELIGTWESGESLTKSSTTAYIRSWFRPIAKIRGYRGFFIIGQDDINLASSRDVNTGVTNLLVKQRDFLETLRSGKTALSKPQLSDVPLHDQNGDLKNNQPTMFVGAPIIDEDSDLIAIMVFRIDPSHDYSAIFQRGRIGNTGETYAIDGSGRLISESRFNNHLRQSGLIDIDFRSILNVEVRDPGVNLVSGGQTKIPRHEQPLTRMAKSALRGDAGLDTDGYRDYRGVPVIGAWLWDDELGLGMTTEIDYAEAYEVLHLNIFAINILTYFSMGLILMVALIFSRSRKRLRKFNEDLETLNLLGQKVTQSLDFDEVLNFFALSAAELLNLPYIVVSTVEDETLRFRANYGGWRRGVDAKATRPLNQGTSGRVARTGKLIYIENVLNEPEWMNKEWARAQGIGSYLGLPLISGANVIGVLSCLAKGVRRFEPSEIELITSLAAQASIAIQNAENHSRLRETLDDLQRSQEMNIRAEKLSSLGVLAAGAAHEILTPAGVIQLRAEMIAEEMAENSPGKQSADFIVRNVKRIKKICDDLRRFSRDDDPSTEPFDPDDALRLSLDLIQHELPLAEIGLDLQLSKTSFTVLGDASQIQQVFINLLTNARDAMPGGGRLSISSEVIELEGGRVWQLKVSDTGVGIPDENLSQIFDPFFTTKPPDKGTGLGLSILHGIVETHGGDVSAESEVGTGTTFIIRLPEADKKTPA